MKVLEAVVELLFNAILLLLAENPLIEGAWVSLFVTVSDKAALLELPAASLNVTVLETLVEPKL